MNQRRILPELLPAASRDEAEGNLRDLRRIHRWLGGDWIIRRLVGRLYRPGDAFSVLDVGAASGETGVSLRGGFPRSNVVSLDHAAGHLRLASGPKVAGDAFHLPFARASFDLVCCSLLLHHFEDEAVAQLLAGMRHVARRGLIAVDLERHILAKLFLPATRPVFGWDAITLHDGPVSVEAGFRAEELRALAARAGLERVRVERHRPWFRLSLVAG